MHPNKKILALITLSVVVVVASVGSYLVYKKDSTVTPPDQVMCTMEAKQCPDGSYVGRQGPKCEFAACPTVTEPTAVYKGSAQAIFEGTWVLPYELTYNPEKIAISTSTKNNEIIIKDIVANVEARVFFSYEGGRGYSVADFWQNEGSKICSTCTNSKDQLDIPGTFDDSATGHVSKTNTWFYVKGIVDNSAWLVVIKNLPAPSDSQSIWDTVRTLKISPQIRTDIVPTVAPSKESSTPKPY